jgi:hypothetical protein
MFRAGDFAFTGISSYGLITGEPRVGLCTLGTLLMRGSSFLGSSFRGSNVHMCCCICVFFIYVSCVFQSI